MRPSLSFFIGPNTIQLDVLPMHDSICTDSLLRVEQNKLNLHDSISREMLLVLKSRRQIATLYFDMFQLVFNVIKYVVTLNK